MKKQAPVPARVVSYYCRRCRHEHLKGSLIFYSHWPYRGKVFTKRKGR